MPANKNKALVIEISKRTLHDRTVIVLSFPYNYEIITKLKTIPSLKYSKTMPAWYGSFAKEDWAAFKSLPIPYTIPTIEDKSHSLLDTNTEVPEFYKLTNNKSTNYTTDQSGTATSPIESDNASIETPRVSPSVYPSHGDSKGTDIHRQKGGRSIVFSNGNFYISIHHNPSNVSFLTSLMGYRQGKIKTAFAFRNPIQDSKSLGWMDKRMPQLNKTRGDGEKTESFGWICSV